MTDEKINRINELARKSRTTALCESELAEQKALRDEYRHGFVNDLTNQLEQITIVEPDGTRVDVKDLKKD